VVARAVLLIQFLRMNRTFSPTVAVLFAAFTLNIQLSAQADTFGTSGNEFTIDFVNIGNAGNAADTTGYGAVPYAYRMGKYEISQNAIDKATASGVTDVTAGPWTSLISEGEVWMDMIKSRNQTTHTYNEKTANEITEAILTRCCAQFSQLQTRFCRLQEAGA
jgi:hypothetical protein